MQAPREGRPGEGLEEPGGGLSIGTHGTCLKLLEMSSDVCEMPYYEKTMRKLLENYEKTGLQISSGSPLKIPRFQCPPLACFKPGIVLLGPGP